MGKKQNKLSNLTNSAVKNTPVILSTLLLLLSIGLQIWDCISDIIYITT